MAFHPAPKHAVNETAEHAKHREDELAQMAEKDRSIMVRWKKGTVLGAMDISEHLAEFGHVEACSVLVPARLRAARVTFRAHAMAARAIIANMAARAAVGCLSPKSRAKQRDGFDHASWEVSWVDVVPDVVGHGGALRDVTHDCPHGTVLLHAQAVTSARAADPQLRAVLAHTLTEQASDEKTAGRLTVHVISATGLPKMDFLGLCDPFVVVKYGERTGRTEVIHHTTKPRWDAAFSFEILDPTTPLLLRAFDWDDAADEEDESKQPTHGDVEKQHDFIGLAVVDVLGELAGRTSSEADVTLWAVGADTRPFVRGEISIRIDFEPAAQPDIEWPAWPHAVGATDVAELTLVVKGAERLKKKKKPVAYDSMGRRIQPGEEEPEPEPEIFCAVALEESVSKYDDAAAATEPSESVAAPVWEQTFALTVDDSLCQLGLEVKDRSRGELKAHLGGCRLPLASLLGSVGDSPETRGHIKHWFKLQPNDAQRKPGVALEENEMSTVVDNEMARRLSCPRGALRVELFLAMSKAPYRELAELEFAKLAKLSVGILRGRGLPERMYDGPFGGVKPFIVLMYGGQKPQQFQTAVSKGCKPGEAVWDERFVFGVADVTNSFALKVYSHDALGNHALLGKLSVSVNELLSSALGGKKPWFSFYAINHKKRGISKPNGQVQLSMDYTPAPEQPAEPAAAARPEKGAASPRTLEAEAADEARRARRRRRRTTALSGAIASIGWLREHEGLAVPRSAFASAEDNAASESLMKVMAAAGRAKGGAPSAMRQLRAGMGRRGSFMVRHAGQGSFSLSASCVVL
jgi:hypothetical protein